MSTPEPSADDLFRVFEKLVLIKTCDERIRGAITAGQLFGPYYSPRGQELISATFGAQLDKPDYVITIYRGLHDHLAKGVPLKSLWAEYCGRATGACKGKGGPMHITHPESGVMVTTGIVGSGIPIANGLAWASKLAANGRVTVTNFGDGATNIGAFHEGLNMASAWQLPVVFVCHNNQYSEHSKMEKFTSGSGIANRANAYGIPGIAVDGMDPIAMWKAAAEALQRARAGEGPTLVEAQCFRFHGHNFGDPALYIPKDEIEAWAARDPYPALRRLLIESYGFSEAKLEEVEAAIRAEVNEAAEYGLSQPFPDESEILLDIYDEEIAL